MSIADRLSLMERMERAGQRVAQGRCASRQAPQRSNEYTLVPCRPGEHLTLMPGEMHFGAQAASLRTVVGSCLALTLWHPERKAGGMCHFLLPSRSRSGSEGPDGRYGDEAVETLVARLRALRTDPRDYHAHLYGGADTMPEGMALAFNIGARNVEQGFNLAMKFGFQIQGVDVGEDVPRSVQLTLATGDVVMRRGPGRADRAAAPVPGKGRT